MTDVTRTTVVLTEGQNQWQKYKKPQLGRGKRERSPEYKAKQAATVMKHYIRTRVNACMMLGGKCDHCGINDMRVLDINHVNHNGATERKSYGTNANSLAVLKRVLQAPTDYQLLCANCHRIWHFEQKEQLSGNA